MDYEEKYNTLKGALVGKTAGTAVGIASVIGTCGLSSALVFGTFVTGPVGALIGAIVLGGKAASQKD